MKEPGVKALWNEVLLVAAELESFEPGLTGLRDQLINALNQEVPSTWIERSKPCLKSDAVLSLAIKLNQIAGLYYSNRQLKNAKAVCTWALALYSAALGADHKDTKIIADNLKRLQASMGRYKAVSINKRSRKQSD